MRLASRSRLRAWAELLRLPALFTVPGDALAGAATTGLRANRGTLLAVGASVCLYEAGMALNDWADREDDAVERPHRPLPSGRVGPTAAFTAAGALTATGLALAAHAGRPALATAAALAGTVWAYDLGLKHTAAGPAAMAAARGLDLVLGAVATCGKGDGGTGDRGPGSRRARGSATAAFVGAERPDSGPRRARGSHPGSARGAGAGRPLGIGAGARTRLDFGPLSRWASGPGRPGSATCPDPVRPRADARGALPSAAALAAHTLAVTAVSRREAQGGSSAVPLAALAATAVLSRAVVAGRPTPARHELATPELPAGRRVAAALGLPGSNPGFGVTVPQTSPSLARQALGIAYLVTAARPLLHAALNPSPQLTQRAVGGGIRAMIPLQAALTARAGSLTSALATAALAPAARTFARKVSVT